MWEPFGLLPGRFSPPVALGEPEQRALSPPNRGGLVQIALDRCRTRSARPRLMSPTHPLLPQPGVIVCTNRPPRVFTTPTLTVTAGAGQSEPVGSF